MIDASSRLFLVICINWKKKSQVCIHYLQKQNTKKKTITWRLCRGISSSFIKLFQWIHFQIIISFQTEILVVNSYRFTVLSFYLEDCGSQRNGIITATLNNKMPDLGYLFNVLMNDVVLWVFCDLCQSDLICRRGFEVLVCDGIVVVGVVICNSFSVSAFVTHTPTSTAWAHLKLDSYVHTVYTSAVKGKEKSNHKTLFISMQSNIGQVVLTPTLS